MLLHNPGPFFNAAVCYVCFLFDALTGEDPEEAASDFSPEAQDGKIVAQGGSHVSAPTVTGNTVQGNININSNSTHHHYHGKNSTLNSTVNDLLMPWLSVNIEDMLHLQCCHSHTHTHAHTLVNTRTVSSV